MMSNESQKLLPEGLSEEEMQKVAEIRSHKLSMLGAMRVYKKPRTMNDLAKALNIAKKSAWVYTDQLRDREWIESVTPERDRGIHYVLTDEGRELLEWAEELEV